MLVNERWLEMEAYERIRDIQREAAQERLAKDARGTRARFRWSLRWLRWPRRAAASPEPRPTVRSLT